jgi:hypothetical protein
MPTPIMHLRLAEEVVRGNDLKRGSQLLLRQQRGPFLLGNTAPDVKAVSGQRRLETHFYSVRHNSGRPAVDALLSAHPVLRQPTRLAPDHAAFVAGYLAHLALDELWLEEIYLPYFAGPGVTCVARTAFAHNVLRTWLDQRALEKLESGTAAALRDAQPDHWLPFTDDAHLCAWRDWLVEQLTPGHTVATAAVFAERMGVDVEEVNAVIDSERGMEDEVFSRIPRSAIESFHDSGYRCCVAQVDSYLDGYSEGETS